MLINPPTRVTHANYLRLKSERQEYVANHSLGEAAFAVARLLTEPDSATVAIYDDGTLCVIHRLFDRFHMVEAYVKHIQVLVVTYHHIGEYETEPDPILVDNELTYSYSGVEAFLPGDWEHLLLDAAHDARAVYAARVRYEREVEAEGFGLVIEAEEVAAAA